MKEDRAGKGPTVCRWCEAETYDLDWCPKCGRQVRYPDRRKTQETPDMCDYFSDHRRIGKRMADGFRMSGDD